MAIGNGITAKPHGICARRTVLPWSSGMQFRLEGVVELGDVYFDGPPLKKQGWGHRKSRDFRGTLSGCAKQSPLFENFVFCTRARST